MKNNNTHSVTDSSHCLRAQNTSFSFFRAVRLKPFQQRFRSRTAAARFISIFDLLYCPVEQFIISIGIHNLSAVGTVILDLVSRHAVIDVGMSLTGITLSANRTYPASVVMSITSDFPAFHTGTAILKIMQRTVSHFSDLTAPDAFASIPFMYQTTHFSFPYYILTITEENN